VNRQESTGSFETVEVDLDAPDAFAKLRAFLSPASTDAEIRRAIDERTEHRVIKVTRWFTLPRAAFSPLIAEPSDAPSVAELMEDLNNALGHPPLGAEPRPPREVWARLILEVRNLAPSAFDRTWQDARDAGAVKP
jgi:hypothetical protein